MLKLFNRKNNINIKKEKSIFDEWATTKNVEGFYNIIERLPNPDIVLRKTGRGIGVLRSLTNHYQVGTCIDSRKAGTKSCSYELLRRDSSQLHYDFYKEVFDILDVEKLIDDILDAPLYGHNPIEISWEKDGAYVVPVKAVAKPHEWFYFNNEGEFFFKDKTHNGKRLIDLNGYKFLLPRNKADFLNPHGQAALSRCFWNVAFIDGGMEFWVKFTEKFGMPFMFGKYERSMTEKEQNDLLAALVNMVQSACGVIPADGSVEILPTGTTGNSDIYEKLVTKCENNISKAILGQTLTTDIGNAGSYAAGQVHACVRADIVNSDKNLVKKTINKFIKIINRVNFNDNIVPEFDFIDQDLGLKLAERDRKVYALGIDFSEDYIIKSYGYQKGDIKAREVNEGINSSELLSSKASVKSEFSDNKNLNIDIKDINSINNLESLTDLKDLEHILTPDIKEVIEFFNRTLDAEEALEKIAELYPELNFKELEETLTKVLFIADLVGRGDNG